LGERDESMAADAEPPESDGASTLVVKLSPATQLVSALSSLLRTLQAAVRETALATPEGARRFGEAPHPVLLASLGVPAGGDGIELRFSFAEHISSRPEPEFSKAAFGAFMDRLEGTLKAQPQRMLWDAPSRPPRTGRPSQAASERIRLLWEDLGRFRRVVLSVGTRRITVSGDAVEIAGN